ncbi:hypothetical protein AB834_02845 [PVC group bacterium (ex Bugula neritina AB1)]|nr:hypothetical protein AB834_02845 [PVC group bacterium (ex Bugula neritina AB1)]
MHLSSLESRNSELTSKFLAFASTQQSISCKRFVNFCMGSLDISKLHDFKSYMIDTGLAPSTVSTHIYRLKGAIRNLIERSSELTQGQKFAIEQVLKKVKAPRPSSKAIDTDKVLTSYEIELLCESLPPSVASICKFLAITGCRISESLSVKISDIQIEADIANVRILGKGDKYRIVKLPSQFILDVKEGRESGFLFSTATGKQQDRRYIHRVIARYGKKLFFKSISPHSLRHSFATSKIKQTGKIKAVSQYLGHSSSSITLDMYTHESLSNQELFSKLF